MKLTSFLVNALLGSAVVLCASMEDARNTSIVTDPAPGAPPAQSSAEDHPVSPGRGYHHDGCISSLTNPRMWFTFMVLFLGGTLASAAGIGGGGIFVALLILLGSFDAWDAVPLSKAMIFFASIISMYYNVQKSHPVNAGPLICTEAMRLLVPSALVGTFLGVFLNGLANDKLILLLLAFVLATVTFQAYKTAIQTYFLETNALRTPAFIEIPALQTPLKCGSEAISIPNPMTRPRENIILSPLRSRADTYVIFGMLSLTAMLIITVLCGNYLHKNLGRKSVLWIVTGEVLAWVLTQSLMIYHVKYKSVRSFSSIQVLEDYKATPPGETELQCTSVWQADVAKCVPDQERPIVETVRLHTTNKGRDDTWDSFSTCFTYCIVALITGISSGLLGIGGGLIFSPFLLHRDMDPTVAVATAGTCVFFTSFSTTFQYMLIGRIHLATACILGSITTCASFVGVRLVNYVSTRYGRKSYVMFIVAAAVAMSTVACLIKVEFFQHYQNYPSVHDREV